MNWCYVYHYHYVPQRRNVMRKLGTSSVTVSDPLHYSLPTDKLPAFLPSQAPQGKSIQYTTEYNQLKVTTSRFIFLCCPLKLSIYAARHNPEI